MVMNILKLIAAPAALCLVLTLPGRAAEPMTRFDSKSGPTMKVRIEGTSTVHDWQVEGHLIGGSLEVGPGFPIEPGQAATPGKMQAQARAYIPVRSLKSVEKDGSHYSDKMDEVMYEHIKQDANPRIFFSLTDLTLKETAKAKDAPYLFDAKGKLGVAGVTNEISFPVRILPLGDRKLRVSGGTSVKMSDFGVKPPVLVGILSTGDEVKLSFDWPVEQKAPAAAAK